MGVKLVSVEVRDNDIQKALKIFKKRVEASGHIKELKARRYYKKPSVVKRENKNKVLYSREWEKRIEREREMKAK